MRKRIVVAAVLTVVVVVAMVFNRPGDKACLPGATAEGGITWQAKAADDTCLQAYAWAPSGKPRGVVVIVHGIRDHATRYVALAQALTAQGFAVYSQDMRGHGSSGGFRQRFDSLGQLEGDVNVLVQTARAKHPGLPMFVYGHSLGGLIATGYTLDHERELAGLVLSGAALELPPFVKPAQLQAAKVFGVLLPDLPAQPVDDHGFVSTPAAEAEFMADPLIAHINLPAASAKAGAEGIADVNARMDSLTLPLLIMHGAADKQTSIGGSRELGTHARSADKQLVLWDGQAHDLLHEPGRGQVISRVVGWIGDHVH